VASLSSCRQSTNNEMAPVENTTVLFNKIPVGRPTNGLFRLETTSFDIDATQIEQGQVIVALNVFSLDPYLRGKYVEEAELALNILC
jgi:NADPH-dependent curcumin reductase CurA